MLLADKDGKNATRPSVAFAVRKDWRQQLDSHSHGRDSSICETGGQRFKIHSQIGKELVRHMQRAKALWGVIAPFPTTRLANVRVADASSLSGALPLHFASYFASSSCFANSVRKSCSF
jgi:hypothetical protein